ncbi:MAG: hypothetical protein ACK4GN_10435 [Runella sp.]
MQQALMQFKRNLSNVRDLATIYELLETNFPILKNESEEILRAEIVLAVSAFDSFIHDVVREEMILSFLGKRLPTSSTFNQYNISLQVVQKIELESDQSIKSSLLELEIRRITRKTHINHQKMLNML